MPFQFSGKNYSFTVTPELSSKGLSHADVEFIDRGRLLAAVAADRAAIAAAKAQDAANWTAGIQPY